MLYRVLKDHTPVPAIGLGTWRMGGGTEPEPDQAQPALEALNAALDMGYTHIDTAEMYAGGFTEELVGIAIRRFERSSLLITSKVWHTNLGYNQVLLACENSLRRLGTEYLDIYLIHWPNPEIKLTETFQALNKLVASGKVRHIGVSNFSLDLLKQASSLADTPLATIQVPYSLLNRTCTENGVLAYCQQHGIVLTAYTPVEKGRLISLIVLNKLAHKYHSTPTQIALSWLVNQPNVIAIPKSMNSIHLQQNLMAAEVELDDGDVEILNKLGASDQ